MALGQAPSSADHEKIQFVLSTQDKECQNVGVANAKPHRFEEIADDLQQRVLSGSILPGELLPTERELQAAYGVSRTTVRRAYATLAERGWAQNIPNRGVVAQIGISANGSNRIAYIDHVDAVHKSLFFRLHTLLVARGYELVHVDSRPHGTIETIQEAAEMGFAAAFVWPKHAFTEPGSLEKAQSRMPIISVDHSLGGEATELVMSDHHQGAFDVVSHLIRLGRKRIAISGNFTHHEDARLRFNGYVAAHIALNRALSASDFVFSSPQPHPYEDPRLLSYRLQNTDRPDAVFVLHDMSVPAIVEAIFAAGLKVPDDVAVVGFGNDVPLALEQAGLTTVAMNWDLVAETLLERMVARLKNPRAPFKQTLVPTRLVVRGSCGAPAEQWDSYPYEVSSMAISGRLMPSSMVTADNHSDLS